ncbi:MAG: hypothetical protein LBP73_07640 [Clostridiales Family XIII bacterium]|nr:hypothetical protein [Clostridiales Family XIII bacterium]
MKNFKKTIGLFLILSLVLSLGITGCGNSGGNGDAEATGSAEAAENNGSADAADGKVYTWKVQGYSAAGTLQDTWGQNLVKAIEKFSNNRIQIEWYPVGSVVQSTEVPNAIRDGILDAEWGISSNWKSLEYATPLFCSIPGNFSDARDFVMWMKYGGGQEIWEEMLAKYNAVPMIGGVLDMEVFMWANKKASTLEDFKGLKLRMMPFMGEILEDHGLSVVFIPGNEVVPGLERKVIDGGEYGTRATDLSFGFPDVANYYNTPGVHQPCCAIEFVVNADKWNELPDDLKEAVRMACDYNTFATWNDSGAKEIEAIAKLEEMGVEQVKLDEAFVNDMLLWADEWMEENSKTDEYVARIKESHEAWGKKWYPFKEDNSLPYPDWAFEE